MPSGNLGFKRTGRDTVQQAANSFTQTGLKNYNDLLLGAEKVRQGLVTQRIQEEKNTKLNNLKGLFVQSGDDLNTASLKASSYFNRIDSAKDGQALNSIYEELESIREKAASNNKLFGQTTQAVMGPVPSLLEDTVRTFGNLLYKVPEFGAQLLEGAGLGTYAINHKKENIQNNLRKANPDQELFTRPNTILNADDFFGGIQSQITQKKNQQFGDNYVNQFSDITTLKKDLEASLASPNKRSSFNKLKNSYLDNEFNTKGSDFFRDGEDSEAFRKRATETLGKTGGYNEDRYFHYDLENQAINSVKNSLNKKLDQVWNTPIRDKKGQLVRDEAALKDIRESMEMLDKRQKELTKVYAVEEYEHTWDRIAGTGRAGNAIGALGAGLKPFMGAVSQKLGLSDDFENTIEQKALYSPKQVAMDINGNAVMSNQAFYTKQDGTMGFNGSAIVEGGLQMIGQMGPTLVLSSLTEGLLGSIGAKAAAAEAGIATGTMEANALSKVNVFSRGANTLNKGYDRFNKVSVAGKELKLADRLATFSSVYATTYPAIEAEEKKYGGNYKKRAHWKTAVESTAEAAGFPEVGALRMRPMQTSLVGDAARAAGKTMKELPISDRLSMYWNTAKEYGKLSAKQNITEALEEELSLLGNYMYESFDSEEFKDREKTRVNADTLVDTFAESFVGGLMFSAGTTAPGVYQFTRNNNLQKTANWNAANNPELMKAKIKEMHSKGKLSDNETNIALARVDELNGILKSAFGMSELKDAKARLEDKDAQYEYFQNLVARQDLTMVDFDSLDDEGKELLKSHIVAERTFENTSKKVANIKLRLAELKLKEGKTTEEEDKEVEDLNSQLGKLQFIKRAFLRKSELTKEQKTYLIDNELMPPKSEQPLTQEEFEQQLLKIDTSILKTQKRIDRYVNLSADEKQKVLDESYDDQIAAIQKVTNPSMLYNGFKSVSVLLDEYEKKGTDFAEMDKKNAERLKDAYAAKLNELVNVRNEAGHNAIEQQLVDFDFKSVLEANDLYKLFEHATILESNKDFVSEDLHESLLKTNTLFYNTIIGAISNMKPEERIEFLTDYLDKTSQDTVKPVFELDTLNEDFSKSKLFQVEFTQEELDAARLKLIDLRATRRAASLVAKGKAVTPTDLTKEAIDEGLSSEEVKKIEEFNEENKQVVEVLKNVDPTVDESGKSELKDTLAADYQAKKAKFKTFIEMAKVATNLRNLVFGKSTSFDSNYYKLKQIHEKLFTDGNIDEFNKAVGELVKQNPNNIALTQYVDFVNRLLLDFPISPASTPSQTTEVEEPPIENTTNPSLVTAEIKKVEQELTDQDKKKQDRLVSLASPMKTMAVEVDKDDLSRNDPAVVRKVEQINELKTEVDTSKNVILINRKDFMLKFFKEVKGMKNEDALELLNAFEQFFVSNEKGTPLSEELANAVGDKFFESAMLDYFLENSSTGFSVNPDVVLSTVDKDGKLVLVQDYPIDLSLTSSKTKTGSIPWNVSGRVLKSLTNLGYTQEQAEQLILAEHKSTFEQFELMKETVKQGKQVIAPFTVSNGLMIDNPKQLSREELKDQNISDIETKTLADFKLITESMEEAFGKTLQFEIGRLYLNVDGQPVLLSNKKLYPDEAAALTELLFAPVEPDEFDSPEQFRNYLFNLINQADRKNRIYFKENPEYGKVPGVPHSIVIQSTLDDKGVRSYKQLSKEEVAQLLPNMYYKVSKDSLNNKRSVTRFFIYSDGPEAGQIGSANQPYVDYLKDTHTFPVANGTLSKPVNKQIYFTPELKPVPPPLTSATPEPAKPTVQPQAPTTQVVTPSPTVATDARTDNAVNAVKVAMPDADQVNSILSYEEAEEEHKKAASLLPTAQSVFPSKDIYEAIIDQLLNNELTIKAIAYLSKGEGMTLVQSAKESNSGSVELIMLTVNNPEDPAKTFRLYLSQNTAKGNHVIGVKDGPYDNKILNPPTIIVAKEEESKPQNPEAFNAEEWFNSVFGTETTAAEGLSIPTNQTVPDSEVSTPVEGLNERLSAYGDAKVILDSNFYQGERPKGRLNAFKDSVAQVADNLIILSSLDFSEFDFISKEDQQRLKALQPLAEELKVLNTSSISLGTKRTVAVEKRFAELTNQLANEFVNIIGKHVEQQLGKNLITSSPKSPQPSVQTTLSTTLKSEIIYRREDFPETQANTRTPITQKLLDYLADVVGIEKFTEDLSTGKYISWLQNINNTGYAVAEKLNNPRQAFDIIAKYDAELSALKKVAAARVAPQPVVTTAKTSQSIKDRLNAQRTSSEEILDDKTKKEAKENKENCSTSAIQKTIDETGANKPKIKIKRLPKK